MKTSWQSCLRAKAALPTITDLTFACNFFKMPLDNHVDTSFKAQNSVYVVVNII